MRGCVELGERSIDGVEGSYWRDAHHRTVAAPRVSLEVRESRCQPRPQRIAMDVADEIHHVRFVSRRPRSKAVLHQVPHARVPPVEAHRVAGPEAMERLPQRSRAGSEDEMEVIRHEHLGEALDALVRKDVSEAAEEVGPIAVVEERDAAFDATLNYVVHYAGRVESRSAGHARLAAGRCGERPKPRLTSNESQW